MEVDLIIKNVQVFNVYHKKFMLRDVAVLDHRFFQVGEGISTELKSRQILDGEGKYLVPGLIDIHMHIESSMTTPYQFAQAVCKHGVTTIVAEPHEIANVFGIEGIEAMLAVECNDLIDIFYGIPSSVPSTSISLETTGGSIEVEQVAELIKNRKIICLGEVMNFKDLINEENSTINRIIEFIKEARPELIIEGHCPKITGLELSKFIYKGVDGDHTQQTAKTLEEKISNGMFIEIQEKSMTNENIQYLMENNLYEHFCFVTDDVMADRLLENHLNGLIIKAIKMGMSPEMAIYVSTYTPSRRMNLRDRGSIAPGKIADFLLLDDIKDFTINSVYKKGEKIDQNVSQKENDHKNFPEHFYNSIKTKRVSTSDFQVDTPLNSGKVKCRIMKVKNYTTFTEEIFDILEVKDGKLLWENEDSTCCLITVFERYGKNKNKALGLVSGDVIKRGAVATTYAHDHHNLMVMGKSVEDMAKAANWIIENGGGYCVVEAGKIIAAIKLPVGGILSEEPISVTGEKLKKVRQAMHDLGYKHDNEIMSFSTLSLPVSPALKITDKGLIKVATQEIVGLFSEY